MLDFLPEQLGAFDLSEKSLLRKRILLDTIKKVGESVMLKWTPLKKNGRVFDLLLLASVIFCKLSRSYCISSKQFFCPTSFSEGPRACFRRGKKLKSCFK